MTIVPRIRAPVPTVTRSPRVGWRLTLGERAAAEGDPVVEHDVVADLGGLADDDAHPVVDEEPPPDGAPGWISTPVTARVSRRQQPRRRAPPGLLHSRCARR